MAPPVAGRPTLSRHLRPGRSARRRGGSRASNDTDGAYDPDAYANRGRNRSRLEREENDTGAADDGQSASKGANSGGDKSPRPFDSELEPIEQVNEIVAPAAPKVAPPLNEIIGTPGNDTLHGTDQVDKIIGLAGNDRLYGHGGNDHIESDGGSDRAYGGDGNDIVNGGDGDDYVYGDAGNDYVDGGSGRIYFVTITAEDASGNVSIAVPVQIVVPKNQKKN